MSSPESRTSAAGALPRAGGPPPAPDAPLPPETVERSLRASVMDGVAWALMFGMGENTLRAWAIHCKADAMTLALLQALPLFLAGLSQIVSANLLESLTSRKRLFLPGVFVQALTWIPMALLPVLFPAWAPQAVLGTACLYFVCAYFVAPPWNSLMGDLVPPERRGAYFGGRLKLVNLCTLAAIALGGWILHAAESTGHALRGFFAIFAISMAGRLLSFHYLTRMAEPPYRPTPDDRFSLLDFLRRAPKSNFARFVLFTSLILFGANVAGPFFDLYMLRDLQFTYPQYYGALAVATAAQFLTLHAWGHTGDRFGNRKILAYTSIVMPVLPFLWCVSASYSWILFCHALAGFHWAGFNLASTNFLFDAVTPGKRARCVAYFNTFMNTGILIGCLLGGWIAPRLPASLAFGGWTISYASGLPFLFAISGLVRAAVVLVFLPLFQEVKPVEAIRTWQLFFRVLHLSNAFQGFQLDIVGEDRRMKPAEGEVPPDHRRAGETSERRSV